MALFTAPALVAFYVTTESNRTEWIPVFLCLRLSMFTANVVSVFVFTDKPADWTEKKDYSEVPIDETKC
uniref:MFS_1_like domain-containing protein n=1 Tax=Caenorhabditis tropicalis TaxID=1561998 RepID=A0A1I7U703_9PELO